MDHGGMNRNYKQYDKNRLKGPSARPFQSIFIGDPMVCQCFLPFPQHEKYPQPTMANPPEKSPKQL